jgi:predicted nucleotidyltransferase
MITFKTSNCSTSQKAERLEPIMRADLTLPTRKQVAKFCEKNHIRRLALFGSVLRETFGPESDVDILVEFKPGHIPGFFELVTMEEELSELFRRRVDLRTPQDLSRYFRDEVLAEAEVQYVAR